MTPKGKKNIKEHYPEEALYSFYVKHNGSLTGMSKDPDCPLAHINTIRGYRERHNWVERFTEHSLITTENILENRKELLEDGIRYAVKRCVDIMKDEKSSAKEIKVAWEIIKTELGMPTRINFNANLNANTEDKRDIENIAGSLEELASFIRQKSSIEVGD